MGAFKVYLEHAFCFIYEGLAKILLLLLAPPHTLGPWSSISKVSASTLVQYLPKIVASTLIQYLRKVTIHSQRSVPERIYSRYQDTSPTDCVANVLLMCC